MKVAVIGSRNLRVSDLEKYLPQGTDCIVSGGAVGVDRCAAQYAAEHGIQLVEFLPDYDTFGRRAPLVRNVEIVKAADVVLAFWDTRSHGTEFVIEQCRKEGKECRIYTPDRSDPTTYHWQNPPTQLSFKL